MKALTIGGAMIDTIAIIESDRIERMAMLNAETSFLLLEEGRKVEALEVSTHCGGGAVNTAVAMARIGLDVAALIKVGPDDRAQAIIARLTAEGISTRWVMRDARAPTGASVLLSSHDRNAAVFTFRGANTLLQPPDLRDEAFAVDLVYVSNLSNKSADCYPAIVDKGKANGAVVAVNPGVRQLSARGGAFLQHLAQVDILVINRAEADALVAGLVGKFGEGGPTIKLEPGERPPALLARGLTGGGFQMSLPAFLRAFRKLGTKYTVLTDGRGGAYAGMEGELLYCPALEADVAGTAGAGDAFAATFAAYIALGQPSQAALRAAAINAASVVAHVDTQTGLLKRHAIDKQLTASSEIETRTWVL
jgi:ribokinase